MNHTIYIKPSGKVVKRSAPSAWNEMSEKNLVDWAAITLKKLDIGYAIRLAVIMFYFEPKLYFRLKDPQILQLASTLKFLFGDNTLTKWTIGKIRVGFRNYYGPENKLQNITIEEYRRTELYYQAYIKKDDQRALDMLLATLYRPKRKGIIDRDIREDMTELGIRKRAEKMSKLPKKYRQAILLNYEGCRNFISSNFLSKLPKDGEAKPTDIFDFNQIILGVAGGEGKFGTKAETEKANLYDFLQHLITNAEQIEKIKAKR